VKSHKTNEDEFVGFVLSTQPQLLRLAYLVCGDWHRAEDVVQSVLIKMYARWSRIRRDEAPMRYARRAVTNAAIDERRRPWRREQPASKLPDAAAVEEPDIDTVVVQALMGLASRQRAVVVLRYIEDLDVAQTAEVLGISQGTVKSQAAKALSNLRKLLHLPASASVPVQGGSL